MVPDYLHRMRQQQVRDPKSGWPRFLPNSLNIFFIFAKFHESAIPRVLVGYKYFQPSVFSFYDYYWWLLHADDSGFGFFFFKYLPLVILCVCLYIAFRKIFTYAVHSPQQLGWAAGVIVLLILLVIYLLVIFRKIIIPQW